MLDTNKYGRIMKRSGLILMMLFGLFVDSFGQDPQFSQYYAMPLYLNPGFAGTGFKHRVAINSRIQWPSLPQAFVTNAFAWDVNVEKFNSGFGILAMTDKAGAVGLRSTSFGLVYSYKFYLGNKWVVSPGMRFGYSIRDLDFSKLLFGDQIEFGGGAGAPTIDPASGNLRSASYFDFDFGMLMYNDKLWFGMSASHLNEPNTSFIEDEFRLPMKLSAHAGMKIPLNRGVFASDRPTHIAPSAVFRMQEDFTQLDFGINYYYQPVNIGIWYRGIPIQKFLGPTGESYSSHDAIIFLIGFSLWNFDFNYSYDFTISELGVNTNGAHEFSMIYQFRVGKFKKIKEKRKPIPCPAFYNNNLNLNKPAWMQGRKR